MFFLVQALLGDAPLDCLRELYNNANGNMWKNNSKWADGEDYCEFYGVSCDKNSRTIIGISIPNNNASGTIPTCFWDLELQTLNLSLNNFSNSAINLSGMKTLTELDVHGCGFIADNQTLNQGFIKLNLANNNFSNAKLQLDHAESSQIQLLDVSNTGINGQLTMSSLGKLRDLAIANSQIVLVIDDFPDRIQTLDASGALIQDITFETLAEKALRAAGLQVMDVTNTSLQGIFNTSIYRKLHEKLAIVKMGRNPLLCSITTENDVDCQLLQAESIVEKDNQTVIKFRPGRLGLPSTTVLGKLEFHLNDTSNTDTHRTKTIRLQNCSIVGEKALCASEPKVNLSQLDPQKDLGISLDGTPVSVGGLLLDNFMKNRTVTTGPNYIQRRGGYATHDVIGYHSAVTRGANRQPHRAVQPQISVQVSAYSLCPDYVSWHNDLYSQFSIAYPHIANHVKYEYKSMAQTYKGHTTGASSLHGQLEAFYDLLYVCWQKLSPDTFVAGQDCLNTCSDRMQCVREGIPDADLRAELLYCARQDQGLKLLGEHMKWVDTNGATWSPTLYVDGEPTCYWNYGDSEKDCNKIAGSPDELARLLCKNQKMAAVEGCQEV